MFGWERTSVVNFGNRWISPIPKVENGEVGQFPVLKRTKLTH